MVSRNIPTDVKREVRQRCFFGCVICGLPVYEYDHIEEFAVVQKHEAHNITLLCSTHHREKTSKRLPKAIIERASRNPFNANQSTTAPHRWYFEADPLVVKIGGNIICASLSAMRCFDNSFSALTIAGRPVVGFTMEGGEALLTLHLYDRMGSEVIRVERGELIFSTATCDFTMEGPSIVVRDAQNKIDIALIKSDDGIDIERGRIFGGGGLEVTITSAGIDWAGVHMSGNRISDVRTGISLGSSSRESGNAGRRETSFSQTKATKLRLLSGVSSIAIYMRLQTAIGQGRSATMGF